MDKLEILEKISSIQLSCIEEPVTKNSRVDYEKFYKEVLSLTTEEFYCKDCHRRIDLCYCKGNL